MLSEKRGDIFDLYETVTITFVRSADALILAIGVD